MAEPTRRERRRLAAILAADIVGYAALIAADEAGTLARLRALFRDVVQPQVAARGGRIFRLLGDAMLAEFDSAVEALRCALALQAAVAERSQAGQVPIALRIGIALGDVVVEGGDLYGDGVNVAARLEALAAPGGILVSAAVASQAHGRVACVLDDAGPLALKNIPYAVPAFHIRAGQPSGGNAPAPQDRASLAVLPFADFSGEAGGPSLADGITEELTTALARIRWFHVIARNSAFAYKGRHVDIRQVGRELGVRYVLEGSIQRAGGRIRITGQLIEAATARHVWADRFEGAVEDVFALQDTVAGTIAGAIEPALERAEIERVRTRPAGSPDAYELYLRALPLRLRATREDSMAALSLLRQALAMDPGFVPAKGHAITCIVQRVEQGWAAPGEREEGVRMAREAFTAHGDDPMLLTDVSFALGLLARDPEGALDAASRAVALNPNSCWVQNAIGGAQLRMGNPEPAIAHLERALQLHPHDADVGYVFAGLGMAHLMLGRAAEALAFGEKALRQKPVRLPGHRLVIAALVELGRLEEARAAAQRFLQLVPTARADPGYRRLYRDQAFAGRLIAAFRAAGLPD